MKKYILPSIIVLLLIGTFGLIVVHPSNQVYAQTPVSTPTPDSEGRIYYTVQAGEFCATISEKLNVDLATLKSLNGLDDNCVILEGQKLLIAQVEKPTSTAMSAPTLMPAEITPTATPGTGTANICVVLFNDMDGNGRQTEFESYLYGGVVGVNDQFGQIALTGNTVAGDPTLGVTPLCFEDVPEGNYNITMAIPEDFNPTTVMNYPLTVHAGEVATIDFGAQEKYTMPTTPEEAAAEGRSPLIGIIGGLILLIGLGLGFYMWRQHRI